MASLAERASHLEREIAVISNFEGVLVRHLGNCVPDLSCNILFEDDEALFNSSPSSDSLAIGKGLKFIIAIPSCTCALKRGLESRLILHANLPQDYPNGRPSFTIYNVENAATRLYNAANRLLREIQYTNLPNFIKSFSAQIRLEFTASRTQQSYDSWAHIPEPPRAVSFGSGIGNEGSVSDLQANTFVLDEIAQICGNRDEKEFHAYMIHNSRYYREFCFEKLLGCGSFGSVTKVRRGESVYAVKQVPIYKEFGDQLYQEAAVLASLKHRNIVQYIDAWLEDAIEIKTTNNGPVPSKAGAATATVGGTQIALVKHGEASSDGVGDVTNARQGDLSVLLNENYSAGDGATNQVADNVKIFVQHRGLLIRRHNKTKKHFEMPIKYLFILMEYCDENNLMDAITDRKLYETPDVVLELIRQILEALAFIHEKGIVHRDIKPSNIFFKADESLLIKVGDFGLTFNLNDPSVPHGHVGTIHYMAPETNTGSHYDEKVDIFSAGVVLFEMLSPPFNTSMERAEVLSSFATANKVWPTGFKERVDPKVFDLLTSMLEVDPEARPTASELLRAEIFAQTKIDVDFIYRVITQFPFSSESNRLLNTLFTREGTRDENISYYMDFLKDASALMYINFELSNLYRNEFRLRGALRVNIPPLVEVSKYQSDQSHQLLLSDGRLCLLRSNLLATFAELTPNTALVIMRRCSWDTVYQTRGGGCYPSESWHCAYDVVVDYGIIMQEGGSTSESLDALFTAEIISVASRPMASYFSSNKLQINWGYQGLFGTILAKAFGIADEAKAQTIRNIFSEYPKKKSSSLVKHRLAEAFKDDGGLKHQQQGGLLALHALMGNGKIKDLDAFFSKLAALLGPSVDLKHEMDTILLLDSYLQDSRVEYCFDIYQTLENFTKYTFVMTADIGKGTSFQVGIGGCTNALIYSYAHLRDMDEHLSGLCRNAFGFELDLGPLFDHCWKLETLRASKLTQADGSLMAFCSCPRVLIYIGKVEYLLQALSLEQKLQDMLVLTEKVYCENPVGKRVQRLKDLEHAKMQRVRFVITLKGNTTNSGAEGVQYKIMDIINEEEQVLTDMAAVVEYIALAKGRDF